MAPPGVAAPHASKASVWLRRARAPLPLGVGGALLTFVSLAGMLMVVYPAFLSADEQHHLDHVWRVSHGELPELDDGIDPGTGLPGSRYQWTFQHPPLFYLLLAPVVRPLLGDGRGVAATMTGRLVVVAIGALVVLTLAWATARIVREPDPVLVVGTAMVAAVIGPFVGISAAVHNDSLAILASVVALGLAADMLRRGPTIGRLAVLVATGAVGFATRASFLVVLVLVASAVAVAFLRAGAGKRLAARLPAAAGGAAVVLAVPLVVSGWFYARNRRLTGHWTGAAPDFAREVLGRAPRSLTTVATDLSVWRRGVGGLFVYPAANAIDTSWMVEVLPQLVVAVVAALAVMGVARGVRTAKVGSTDLLVGALLALVVAGTVAQYLQHVSEGGAPNPRYLLPALLPICLGTAYGLRAGRRTRGLLLVAFSALSAGLILAETGRVLEDRRYGPTVGIWEAWTRGADFNQTPRSVIPVLLAGLVLGLAVQASALWRLTEPGPATTTID